MTDTDAQIKDGLRELARQGDPIIMSRLQELALDLGCDVEDWPEKDQRAAVVELFEQDEAKCVPGKYPDWIGDCLSEKIACNEVERKLVIQQLKKDDRLERLLALGTILERALLTYPLDTLTDKCWSNIRSWRFEQRTCMAEDAADRAAGR